MTLENCELCQTAKTGYDWWAIYSPSNCYCWICYECIDEDHILREPKDEGVDYVDDNDNIILRPECPVCNVRLEKQEKIEIKTN